MLNLHYFLIPFFDGTFYAESRLVKGDAFFLTHRLEGSDNLKKVRKEIVGMQQLTHNTLLSEHGQSETAHIETTLGELIGAINEEVGPEEDYLVSKTVLHLIEAGGIRFLNPRGCVEISWAS